MMLSLQSMCRLDVVHACAQSEGFIALLRPSTPLRTTSGRLLGRRAILAPVRTRLDGSVVGASLFATGAGLDLELRQAELEECATVDAAAGVLR